MSPEGLSPVRALLKPEGCCLNSLDNPAIGYSLQLPTDPRIVP